MLILNNDGFNFSCRCCCYWVWMFILCFTNESQRVASGDIHAGDQVSTASPGLAALAPTTPPVAPPAVHQRALQRIALLISLIATLRSAANASQAMDGPASNSIDFMPSTSPALFLQQFQELCHILGPKYKKNQMWPKPYMPVISFQPADRFGCIPVLTTLSNDFSHYSENLTSNLDYAEKNLRQWQRKLQGPHSNAISTVYSSKATTNRPPHSATQSTTVIATVKPLFPYLATSTLSSVKWNKGLSRYDNSWVKPGSGNKNSGKEILLYDNYDITRREDPKLSLGRTAIRVLPALIVIAFLVLCWYFFVYRRMQQRQQRARQLLSQYQSLLTGARISTAGSGVVVVNEPTANGSSRVVVCSSTFDSSLDDLCRLAEELDCPHIISQQPSPSRSAQTQNNDTARVQSSEPTPNPSRPAGLPPTYEEIFPPSYESIFGTIV